MGTCARPGVHTGGRWARLPHHIPDWPGPLCVTVGECALSAFLLCKSCFIREIDLCGPMAALLAVHALRALSWCAQWAHMRVWGAELRLAATRTAHWHEYSRPAAIAHAQGSRGRLCRTKRAECNLQGEKERRARSGGTECVKAKKSGGAGYRSPCPSHAKRVLYHLSYTPGDDEMRSRIMI